MGNFGKRGNDTFQSAGDLSAERCSPELLKKRQTTIQIEKRLVQFAINARINLNEFVNKMLEKLRARQEEKDVEEYGIGAYRTTGAKNTIVDKNTGIDIMQLSNDPELLGEVIAHLVEKGWENENGKWKKRKKD